MNAIEKEKIKEKLAEEIVETKQKVSKYKVAVFLSFSSIINENYMNFISKKLT